VRLDLFTGSFRSVVTFSRLGTLAKDSFAPKLSQALVEKVASKRRRPNASRGSLSIEKPALLWVKTDRDGVSHVL
jgi:hypothetical protein